MNSKGGTKIKNSDKESGSKPIYEVKVDKDVYVEMRDGVQLAADIYRPKTDEEFPALLSMSPYGKDKQELDIEPKPLKSPKEVREKSSMEAGMSEYFVKRGYVHVIVDVRGSEKSEGKYHNVFSKQEQEDGYDLVEWIARQPWCDGNVGMLGISYYGIIQYLVAAQQPPHLEAIFPYDAFTDLYRDATNHGGIPCVGFGLFWYSTLPERINLVSEVHKNLEIDPDELTKTVEENEDLLRELYGPGITTLLDDVKNHSSLWEIFNNPEINPIVYDFMLFPTDGPFYWERSAHAKFDKIKVPVYMGSRWPMMGLHLRGPFTAWEEIETPKKLLIGPEPMVRPFDLYHDIILRWYDHWLKGIDTGIMDESPVKIYVRGIDQWRNESEWPLARTEWTKYYLHRGGILNTTAPGEDENPDSYLYQPPDERKEKKEEYYLRYETSDLEKDMEVTGPIALYLHASSTASDTNWIARIEDVRPDGTKTNITKGWLRASHRKVDEAKSKPWKPYHPHKEIIPIEPEKIYEYAIEIWPTSNVFKTGHKIRLEIRSDDGEPEVLEDMAITHLPCSREMTNTVYHSSAYPSHLLLPIV